MAVHVLESKYLSLLWESLTSFMDKGRIWRDSSVVQLYPTVCNPMDCSMPGLPGHHQLPEFTQTHVHWVGDAIQPSHPLSSPSPLTFNLPASGSFQMSQFFASGGQSTGISASVSVLPQAWGWYSASVLEGLPTWCLRTVSWSRSCSWEKCSAISNWAGRGEVCFSCCVLFFKETFINGRRG